GGAVVGAVGIVGRRYGDRVDQLGRGRRIDRRRDGIDDTVGGARVQTADGVAEGAGAAAAVAATPGEAGHAGRQQVADRHVGGRVWPAVADGDRVREAGARHHRAGAGRNRRAALVVGL